MHIVTISSQDIEYRNVSFLQIPKRHVGLLGLLDSKE